ncbi:MAG: 3-phosphoshikimate 1-carboxyvinyltransferase [Victivallaceae bacterium]|nr:3-phosphoshikimate 1-carboxyvinyltransferase [Victivallaceae bacterium]
MELSVKPSKVSGAVAVPGSKSHTIRAIAAALLARGGRCVLRAPLTSQDTLSTLRAAEKLGLKVEKESPEEWILVSDAANSFPDGGLSLDLGNSGTGVKFLAAIAAAHKGVFRFDGDSSLRSRPMAPLLDALAELGCNVSSRDGKLPFSVEGPMGGGVCRTSGESSQYLSALLFGAAALDGGKTIEIGLDFLNERPYVEMTLDWLERLGIRFEASPDRLICRVAGGQSVAAFTRTIPADFSTALFPLAAGLIAGGGAPVKIANLDFSDRQGDKRVFSILEQMGGRVEYGAEAVSVYASKLHGGNFDLNDVPDALPILAVTAAFAEGTTRFFHVSQARIKETDRIHAMALELKKFGVDLSEVEDGLIIHGGAPLRASSGLNSYGDHRIAMALAVAALASETGARIADAQCAEVTYPAFFGDFEKLGASFAYQP